MSSDVKYNHKIENYSIDQYPVHDLEQKLEMSHQFKVYYHTLETVYKQNLKTVGWANQRLILTTHNLKNFAHLTKLAVNVSLTNGL